MCYEVLIEFHKKNKFLGFRANKIGLGIKKNIILNKN